MLAALCLSLLPEDGRALPGARVTIGPIGGGQNASTFASGSFAVRNLSTAGERITRIHIDLRTAVLPDLVFDPDGTAGDPVGKPFTADSGAAETGLVSSGHDHPAQAGGFSGLEILFGSGAQHFDPNELFTFSIDIDPTSIAGAPPPGPSQSGSVSGLELSGATVTIEFDNEPAAALVGTPFALPGSDSASELVATLNRPPAPRLTVPGLAPPSVVGQASQRVRVQGTPNAQVTLLQLEAALFTAGVPGGGFDLDPFEANSVIAQSEQVVTLDGAGEALVDLTLRRSDLAGGINVFLAVEHGVGTSDGSNPILLEYDPALGRISFFKTQLAGTAFTNPTTLQFGPDGRLYVGQQDGLIQILTVQRNGLSDFSVVGTETLTRIREIPNHNDDGLRNPSVPGRQITGLLVAGTPANPTLYVGSSDPRIGGGTVLGDTDLDTNSGVLTRLRWSGSSWEALDLVRGLPRSEENHSINGLALDGVTNTLYATIGGFTNMGGVSNNFAFVPEYALSAAILSIDLDAIGDTTYDLPTLDDEDRPNPDANDPFGGNNGKNQAVLVPGGPVQVYSPGWRNVYDILLTEAGRMYTVDNGANAGWGDVPVGEGPPVGNPPIALCTNEVSEPGTDVPDGLHFVDGPGYYGGHPNPTRANRSNTFNPSNPQSPVPPGLENPIECDFLSPVVENGALTAFPASTNGLAEYAASAFGGMMQGDLLAASFSNQIKRVKTNEAGDTAVLVEDLFSSVDTLPLDLTTQGDDGEFPGTIWVADYLSGNIVVYEPNPGGGVCTGDDDPAIDEDADGFDNTDEIDNGTDPCSPGDTPPDIDGDFISDRLDPDDDNDGLPDTSDPFALDPDNGSTTHLPVFLSWDNDAPRAGGLLGLGFQGLMTNGVDDYATLFDPASMTAGGAAGVTTVGSVSAGDARGNANDQEFALQVGFVPEGRPIVASTAIAAPFAGLAPSGGESIGFYVGRGDQDNYIKVVVTPQGVATALEVAGSYTSGPSVPLVVPGPESVELQLAIDPAAATAQASYRVTEGGVRGALVPLGAPIALPAVWFDAQTPLAVGLISSSAAGSPFPASWDYLQVIPDHAVLYRINSGGPRLGASDDGGDWLPDESFANTGLPYRAGGSVTPDATVSTAVPTSLFLSERFDKPAAPNLRYSLPIVPGSDYEVRLYFAEVFFGSPGSRRFDVLIEGMRALAQFDIAAEVGPRVGTMRAIPVSPSGSTLDLEFSRLVENPKISGIEIVATEINESPLVVRPTNRADDLGVPVDVTILADDPDGDPLTYRATGLPPGLALDMSSGRITGVPTALGLFPIAVEVSDGTHVTRVDFQWTIRNPSGNNPPAITPPGDQTHGVGESVSLPIVATDLDLDPLSYSATGLPAGLSISPGSGLISGTPTAPSGGPLDVSVSVSDGRDTSLASFTWSITPPPNNPPQVVSPGSQSDLAGDPVALQIVASDADLDPLQFSAVGLPAGVAIDAASGLISGTLGAPGLAMVSVTVSDGIDPVVVHFDWNVADPSGPSVVHRVNAGGATTPAPDGRGAWLSDIVFVNTGRSYSAASVPSPDGSVPPSTPAAIFQSERFDAAGGPELRYHFPVASGASYEVRLYFAEIFFGGPGARVFDVRIDGALVFDDFDIVAAAGPATGTMRSVTVTASSDTLAVEFLHEVENPKVSAIEIVQLDGNRPPIVSDPGPQSSVVNEAVTLQISATDPDLDPLAYGATGLPTGLRLDASTGLISGIPRATGNASVTLRVSDGTGTTTVPFSWTVTSPGTGVVLYRVNAGGSAVPALDAFADWEPDTSFVNTGSRFSANATVLLDGTIPASTPVALFTSERWDPPTPPTLSYAFAVTPGRPLEVRLFFAEIFFANPGQRFFDVAIEGAPVLDDFDINAEAGFLVGTMRSFTLTPSDDTLTIDFFGELENPKVSAIEIVGF